MSVAGIGQDSQSGASENGAPGRGEPEGTGRRLIAAEGILLLVTVIWGTTFPLVKSLLGSTFNPMGLLTWRFGVAVIAFLALFGRRMVRGFDRGVMLRGLSLGVILYAGYALQTLGLDNTSSSRSGFITALYVIVTPLLQVLVLRRMPRSSVMIGALLAVLGVWGLTAPGGELSGLIDPWRKGGINAGDLMTFGCAVTFAGYMILLDRFSAAADPLSLTGWQLITVFVLAATHASLVEPWTMPGAPIIWGMVVYLSVVATVATTYWQTRYQPAVSPSRAGVIFTLESVFGALFSFLFLGERLGTTAIIGAGLIVAGILVVELMGRRQGHD